MEGEIGNIQRQEMGKKVLFFSSTPAAHFPIDSEVWNISETVFGLCMLII